MRAVYSYELQCFNLFEMRAIQYKLWWLDGVSFLRDHHIALHLLELS